MLVMFECYHDTRDIVCKDITSSSRSGKPNLGKLSSNRTDYTGSFEYSSEGLNLLSASPFLRASRSQKRSRNPSLKKEPLPRLVYRDCGNNTRPLFHIFIRNHGTASAEKRIWTLSKYSTCTNERREYAEHGV